MASMSSYVPLTILLTACSWTWTTTATTVEAQLTNGFYSSSCPNAEAIVKSTVESAFHKDPSVAHGLFSLHFHDCFAGASPSFTIDCIFRKGLGSIRITSMAGKHLCSSSGSAPYYTLPSLWSIHMCFDIFSPKEQAILKTYREKNFAKKNSVYNERRAIGKWPLTPEEVGLILRATDFVNSTRIYLAAGELFGGERFMNPFRSLFPRLENHSSVDSSEELSTNSHGLLGSPVDYMVCLLADIFMPTYDGPSNFTNNLLGHRLYYGFRTTIRPDRKGLAPIFIDRENMKKAGFEEAVRRVMLKTNFGGPHKRISPESFYTNSWSECFCQAEPQNAVDKCPPDDVWETLYIIS